MFGITGMLSLGTIIFGLFKNTKMSVSSVNSGKVVLLVTLSLSVVINIDKWT